MYFPKINLPNIFTMLRYWSSYSMPFLFLVLWQPKGGLAAANLVRFDFQVKIEGCLFPR